MSKALSLDLRVRVLAAVAGGLSHRAAAAARFGVSAASVSRWRRRAVVLGDPRPRALGGDRRSGCIEAHRALILGVLAEAPRHHHRGVAPPARWARAELRLWHDPALPRPPPDDAQEEDGPRE